MQALPNTQLDATRAHNMEVCLSGRIIEDDWQNIALLPARRSPHRSFLRLDELRDLAKLTVYFLLLAAVGILFAILVSYAAYSVL